MFAASPDFSKRITIGLVGTAPLIREIYSYARNAYLPSFPFLSRTAGRTAGPISTLEGSFDADSIKEVPFQSSES
jgi:hypothetical protein